MRAISTTAVLPAASRLPILTVPIPPRRGIRLFGGLRRRPQPTLFHRCLAVHIATAGTLSALR